MFLHIMLLAFVFTSVYVTIKLAVNYYRYLTHPLRHAKLGPSQNSGGFLWGQFWVIQKEPFMEPHLRWIRQDVGWDAPFLFYTLLLGRSSLLILDKEIVKEILTAPYGKQQPLRFVKDVQFIRIILGDGLVTLQGSDWMRHRTIIQPAFSAQSLKEKLTSLVPSMTLRLVDCWKRSQCREIDVTSHLSALTLDIIGRAAFSHDFAALKSVVRWAQSSSGDDDTTSAATDDPLIRAFTGSLNFTWISTTAFILGMPWINRWFNRSTIETRRMLNAGVDEIVKNARRSQETNNTSKSNSNDIGKKSLLQLLMDAREGDASQKRLNDHELRDEVKTFIFAGHETTQTWCYQAIFALCQYPDIQEKVYQDIRQHVTSDDGLCLSVVENMEYFNAFLQEVLRMHPPIGMITRSTNMNGETFGTDFQLPKHTRLVIPAYLLHRHPKYWKDPETFQPERWIFPTDREREEFMAQIRFAFLPFSAGGRNCVGQRFAVIEAKLIMAELIRSFVFQKAPSQRDTAFTMSNMVVMQTKPRLKVVVKARSE